MITTVFRTEDGEIFETEQEALDYEAEEMRLKNLIEELQSMGVYEGYDTLRDVLVTLSERYDVVPKAGFK